eukprot:1335897-Amorphochlora_amoeboformis.AAC.1
MKTTSRLYFLLAWLHSVVLERLRFTPVGWTKSFQFSEADQRCAMDSIDEWVDRVAKERLNVRPEQLPWDAIQTSLEIVIYGTVQRFLIPTLIPSHNLP